MQIQFFSKHIPARLLFSNIRRNPFRIPRDLSDLPRRAHPIAAEIQPIRPEISLPGHTHPQIIEPAPSTSTICEQFRSYPIPATIASKSSPRPSAKRTTAPSIRSTPPKTRTLPSRISLTIPISNTGAFPSRTICSNGPYGFRRKPSALTSPSTPCTSGRLMTSATRGGKIPQQ